MNISTPQAVDVASAQALWVKVQAGTATETERAQYEQDKRAMWKASRS